MRKMKCWRNTRSRPRCISYYAHLERGEGQDWKRPQLLGKYGVCIDGFARADTNLCDRILENSEQETHYGSFQSNIILDLMGVHTKSVRRLPDQGYPTLSHDHLIRIELICPLYTTIHVHNEAKNNLAPMTYNLFWEKAGPFHPYGLIGSGIRSLQTCHVFKYISHQSRWIRWDLYNCGYKVLRQSWNYTYYSVLSTTPIRLLPQRARCDISQATPTQYGNFNLNSVRNNRYDMLSYLQIHYQSIKST